MYLLKKPSDDRIGKFTESQSRLDFTYPSVGATRNGDHHRHLHRERVDEASRRRAVHRFLRRCWIPAGEFALRWGVRPTSSSRISMIVYANKCRKKTGNAVHATALCKGALTTSCCCSARDCRCHRVRFRPCAALSRCCLPRAIREHRSPIAGSTMRSQ